MSLKRTSKRLKRSTKVSVEIDNLPMVFRYRRSEFYNRECYSRYFDLIIGHWNAGKRIITVTGSPGIGKSVFYIYVVQRFRNEYNVHPIVLASFGSSGNLLECFISDQGSDQFIESKELVRNDNAMYFLDGAPDMTPPRNKAVICFTSPNRQWARIMSKSHDQTKVHMPIWTEGELIDASEALGLTIDRAEIQRRYGIFGGVPRICLTETLVVAYVGRNPNKAYPEG